MSKIQDPIFIWHSDPDRIFYATSIIVHLDKVVGVSKTVDGDHASVSIFLSCGDTIKYNGSLEHCSNLFVSISEKWNSGIGAHIAAQQKLIDHMAVIQDELFGDLGSKKRLD